MTRKRILWVVCSRAARGQGPAVGGELWEVPVRLGGTSVTDYESALQRGRDAYAERFQIAAAAVYVFGSFEGADQLSEGTRVY